MGLLFALVAALLFVLAGLDVSVGSVDPHQLGWFGLASLTLALILGISLGILGRNIP